MKHLKVFEEYWTAGHEDWTPEDDADVNPATDHTDNVVARPIYAGPGQPVRTEKERNFSMNEMGRKTTEIKKSIEDSDIPRLKKIIDEVGVEYDNGLAARLACRFGNQEAYETLVDLGYKPTERQRQMEGCWAAEHYQLDMIKFLYNTHGSVDGDKVKKWIVHSRKLDDQKRKEIGEFIDSLKSIRRQDRADTILPESNRYRSPKKFKKINQEMTKQGFIFVIYTERKGIYYNIEAVLLES